MKGKGRIRKQLQAYLCMLAMAVQSLTPVVQVSAEEVTTVDVSAQAAEAEMAAENAEDIETVSDAGIRQEIPTCNITEGIFEEADGWSFKNVTEFGYKQVTIRKNGTYRLTGSNALEGYNFYINVESGLDDVTLILDDVVIQNPYYGYPGIEPETAQAAAGQEAVSTYQQSCPMEEKHIPLVLGSDTKVTLQGTASMEGSEKQGATVWGDEGSSLIYEEGVFYGMAAKASNLDIQNALLFLRGVYAGSETEKLTVCHNINTISEGLDLESVWIGGQNYDVSGLGIQTKENRLLLCKNFTNTPSITFLFDGGILYSYRYLKAIRHYKQVEPMQEHCTVIYEEDGYEVGRAYCVPGGNVELWPSNENAQMQYVVKDTGESFDGCNVTEDMIVELLPDTAYKIDVTINGEVKQFTRGTSLPEGYFYIEQNEFGNQTVYDCRKGKETVVVKKPLDLLALPCGEATDHLEFLIDSAESLYAYETLLRIGYSEDGETASEAYLKLTADITLDHMLETFGGTLDGQNHTITLELTKDKTNKIVNVGLFQVLEGTVKNLTIDGSIEIDEPFKSNVGGLAGYMDCSNASIDNCISDVNIYLSGEDMQAGGLFGEIIVSDGELQIRNCKMTGLISMAGTNSALAGLAAFSKGTVEISDCSVKGELWQTGAVSYVGGIVGNAYYSNFRAERCSVLGESRIEAADRISGIADTSSVSDLQIEDCIVAGELTLLSDAASVFGITAGTKGSTVKNCFDYLKVMDADGTVVSHNEPVYEETVENSYIYQWEKDAQPTLRLKTVTKEQVENGELCGLLNAGRTKSPIWHQTIGTDAYPLPDKTAKPSAPTEEQEHTYQFLGMNWSEDGAGNVSAEGSFRCKNCKDSVTEKAVITEEQEGSACEEDSRIYYTATITRDGKNYTGIKTVKIPATGHTYGNWELAADKTGVRTCQNKACDKKEICDHMARGKMKALEGTAGCSLSESCSSLFDGDVHTKWCTDNTSAYVIFQTENAVAPTGYILTTGNDNKTDPGRNPKSWKLYAMNAETVPDRNAEGWVEIASVSDDTTMQDENFKDYKFTMTRPAEKYCYFKLEITAIHGKRIMQLSEFELLTESSTYTKTVSADACIPASYEATFCSVCGLNISEEQEKENHAYVEELIAPEVQKKSEATCEKKAVYYAICKRCHRLDPAQTFEAGACGPHMMGPALEYRWNKDDSCDLVYICFACKSTLTKKMEVTRKDLQARTCVQSGKYVLSAVLEEDNFKYKAPDREVKVPAAGHALAGGSMKFTKVTGTDGKPVITALLPVHCNNENCTYRQNIPAIVEAGKDTATCVADGAVIYTAKVIWNAQTYTDTYQIKTAKLGHKLKSHVAKKDATTEQAGMQAYYTCENCDGKFADQALTKPVTDAELAIPKLTAPEGQPNQNPQPSQNPQPGQNPQGDQKPDTKPEVIKQKDGSSITILNKKKKEVSYTGAKKTKASLTVPAKVKIGKKTYKVTKLADYAFKGNRKLKKLTLPKNCSYIGTEVFSGCTKLKTLTIRSTKLTAQTVADNAFQGMSKKTVIKVPKSKLKEYRKLFRAKGLDKKVKLKAI